LCTHAPLRFLMQSRSRAQRHSFPPKKVGCATFAISNRGVQSLVATHPRLQ